MLVSYLSYGAAFVRDAAGSEAVDPALIAVGLTVAPFVFVVLAFVSRNPKAPMHVLQAMGLLVLVGLGVGLLDPLAGAATGFAAGAAAALRRPDVEFAMAWRFASVFFTGAYCLILLILITPAGVFAGATVPLIMIGFADEYARRSAGQRRA